MWVHEDVEAIALCYPQHLDCMGNKVLVVFPRPCMLQRLPCENIPNCVITPSLQAAEMSVCFVFIERSSHERYIIGVEEVPRVVRWLVRSAWEFGISSNIDPPEGYLAVSAVPEPRSIYFNWGMCHLVVADW